MTKTYAKVIEYIKEKILDGTFKPGNQIPPERELAEILGSSRNSIREGLRILDNMGVINSHQGSGNYIADNFEDTLTEIMSFMYVLKDMDEDHITEFRYALEGQAVYLAVNKATEKQKKSILQHYEKMKEASTEEERVRHDKAIHYTLIEATDNDYMIASYKALTNVMDRYIPKMRGKIISAMKGDEMLGQAHKMLVEGIYEGNLVKSIEGINLHFKYINEYKN